MKIVCFSEFFFFFAKVLFCCNVLKLNKTLNWSQACVLYSSVIWLTKVYCACSKVLACNVNLVSRVLLLICVNLWITVNKSFTCNYWISLWKINHIKSFYGQIDFKFDKWVVCKVCIWICPIDLLLLIGNFWNKYTKKWLLSYSIDFGICIFYGNYVEYCPTNYLSMIDNMNSQLNNIKN